MRHKLIRCLFAFIILTSTVGCAPKPLTREFSSIAITFVNQDEDLMYRSTVNIADVTVTGPQKEVEALTQADIQVYADVNGLTMGTYPLDLATNLSNKDGYTITLSFAQVKVIVEEKIIPATAIDVTDFLPVEELEPLYDNKNSQDPILVQIRKLPVGIDGVSALDQTDSGYVVMFSYVYPNDHAFYDVIAMVVKIYDKTTFNKYTVITAGSATKHPEEIAPEEILFENDRYLILDVLNWIYLNANQTITYSNISILDDAISQTKANQKIISDARKQIIQYYEENLQ